MSGKTGIKASASPHKSGFAKLATWSYASIAYSAVHWFAFRPSILNWRYPG